MLVAVAGAEAPPVLSCESRKPYMRKSMSGFVLRSVALPSGCSGQAWARTRTLPTQSGQRNLMKFSNLLTFMRARVTRCGVSGATEETLP